MNHLQQSSPLLLLLVAFASSSMAFADPKSQCEEYCKSRESCDRCSTLRNCGAGYEAMAHFTRGGKTDASVKLGAKAKAAAGPASQPAGNTQHCDCMALRDGKHGLDAIK